MIIATLYVSRYELQCSIVIKCLHVLYYLIMLNIVLDHH